VEADALGRFLVSWHGIGTGRKGHEALLDAIEQLQGAAIPATVLEREVLPARVDDYQPAMLDTLMAAGEVVWVGIEPIGERDGRVALYLTDHLARLRPPRDGGAKTATVDVKERAAEIVEYLRDHGASFFAAIHDGTGGGFPQETVDALWTLVWKGIVTNDTLHALRAYTRTEEKKASRRERPVAFRSRRLIPRKAEGRWALVDTTRATRTSMTDWAAATAQQLLTRHGVVTRETVAAEAVAGGFTAVYEVLKAMEEAGRIRRGYFVAGLGAAQFALPAALDLLRSARDVPETPRTVVLASTDPANPYGSLLKWPEIGGSTKQDPPSTVGRGPTRSVGSLALIVNGFAAAYLRRGERELLLFLPEDEPRRSQMGREAARMLMHLAGVRDEGYRGMLISEINGISAPQHPAARLFLEQGFATTALGLQARTERLRPRGFGSLDLTGIGIAAPWPGGSAMADNDRDVTFQQPHRRRDETTDSERERIRSSNDRDQQMERDGKKTEHDRGYDEAVHGIRHDDEGDIDPDSAESDIDRDDTVDD
jgi:ATP-dependent Lhr-like helicase